MTATEAQQGLRIVIESGDRPYIVMCGETELGRFPRVDYAQAFVDGELSRTESACQWFDSLPPWACVICGKDAETCEHYEEAIYDA